MNITVSFVFMIVGLTSAVISLAAWLVGIASFNKREEDECNTMAIIAVIICVISFLVSYATYRASPTTVVDGQVTGKNQYFSAKTEHYAVYIDSSEYDLSQDQYNLIQQGDNVEIVLESGSVQSVTRK